MLSLFTKEQNSGKYIFYAKFKIRNGICTVARKKSLLINIIKQGNNLTPLSVM